VPSKRITSLEVARQAGVSRTTVSLVLNDVPGTQISENTRNRVIRAVEELGYVPVAAAKALASQRTQVFALILTRSPHHIASDAFLTQILDSLVQTSHQNRMRLMIDIVEDVHHPDVYLDLTRARSIDGIIFSGPKFDDQALRALEEDGFPTVLMGQLPETSFYSVDIDNCTAAKIAVDHLIKLGHTQIACITNAPVSFTAAADRLHGYREALKSAGLQYDPRLVRHGNFDLESGYIQMKSLLERKPVPSAVFVASDVLAFGAMAAIREQGLSIPGDLALVGFDDVPFARYIDPPLTSVFLPAAALAREASNLLFQLIRGEQPPERNLLLGTHLVVRQSCGAG
jgi:LacI family transcriptional regulator